MIDPTKSPASAWRRYGTIAVLGLLIVVAAFLIYTKEIRKSSPSAAPPSPVARVATAHPTTAGAKKAATPATTIPGGIPISSRNPFGS